MKPRRPKTEAEKTTASDQMKRHWRRCEAWGEVLGTSKTEMNDHWSCCIKPHLGSGVPGVKAAYTEHLLRDVQHSKRMEEWQQRVRVEKFHVERPRRPKKTDQIPELDQRIRIMLWSIRTCGGVENTKDALDRAIKALEDK